jgi:hypothetical protein
VGQVAVSLVLLVTAALFLRSVQREYLITPGFETKPRCCNFAVSTPQPLAMGPSTGPLTFMTNLVRVLDAAAAPCIAAHARPVTPVAKKVEVLFATDCGFAARLISSGPWLNAQRSVPKAAREFVIHRHNPTHGWRVASLSLKLGRI